MIRDINSLDVRRVKIQEYIQKIFQMQKDVKSTWEQMRPELGTNETTPFPWAPC